MLGEKWASVSCATETGSDKIEWKYTVMKWGEGCSILVHSLCENKLL